MAPRDRLPARQRKFKMGTTSFMLVMHVLATVALLPRFWSWQGVVAFGVLYWMTVLGVTLGLHRLVAHRSLVVPVWVERILVLMGTLACQSGPIEWVGLHRHHHRFSDQPTDHHDAGRGLWWAHSEWMLHDIPALKELDRYAGDLQCDPFYRWLDRWFLLLQIPLGLGLYWFGEAAQVHGGGLGLVLWAIPLRLVVVYHVTWLVNSATHAFGYRNFDCPDLSRNCWGWHCSPSVRVGTTTTTPIRRVHATVCAGSSSISPGSTCACSSASDWPAGSARPATSPEPPEAQSNLQQPATS